MLIQKVLDRLRAIPRGIDKLDFPREKASDGIDQQRIMRTTEDKRVDPVMGKRLKIARNDAIRQLIVQPALLN